MPRRFLTTSTRTCIPHLAHAPADIELNSLLDWMRRSITRRVTEIKAIYSTGGGWTTDKRIWVPPGAPNEPAPCQSGPHRGLYQIVPHARIDPGTGERCVGPNMACPPWLAPGRPSLANHAPASVVCSPRCPCKVARLRWFGRSRLARVRREGRVKWRECDRLAMVHTGETKRACLGDVEATTCACLGETATTLCTSPGHTWTELAERMNDGPAICIAGKVTVLPTPRNVRSEVVTEALQTIRRKMATGEETGEGLNGM